MAADTSKPLRRAQISLSLARPGEQGRTTNTNADGRYEFKDVIAGQYTLTVNRSGYLPLRYGQRRPYEPRKLLKVAEGQALDRIDFSLPKMGLIAGRVLDEAGEPIAGVGVFAMRSAFFQGRRQLVPAPSGRAVTDDAGQYRLSGLPPGSYYVLATTRETWTVNRDGKKRVMGYATTYFPGTDKAGDGRRVTVGIGQLSSGNDFSMIPAPTASVSGSAFDSHGKPLTGVGLTQQFVGPDGGSYGTAGNATVDGDGTFIIRNIPPGDYRIGAQLDRGANAPEAATVPIVVNGADVNDVSVITSLGWSAKGQVISENGGPPNLQRDRISIAGRPIGEAPRVGGAFGSGLVTDDWTFTVTGIFGPARLVVGVPDEWMVKSIFQNGLDVTDAVIELKSGEELTGVQVILSDHVTTITGLVTDAKGAPIDDGTVIVFSSDEKKWYEESRFVKAARPDERGQFTISGLPPGDYLAIAVEYVQEGLWNDPEYLDSIRTAAQKFIITDRGSQGLTLKLVTP